MAFKDIMEMILNWMFLIVAVLMIFFILLQEGKGGGLAALGGTKAAGVEGVTNPIRRFTGYLAAIFFIVAIVLGIMNRPDTSHFKGENKADKASAETPAAGDTVKAPPTPAEPAKTETKTDASKPAEPAKTEAPKAGELKSAEPAKTEAPKTTEPAKAGETPKTDAAKPADTKPATDAKAPETKAPEKADTKTEEKK